MNVGVAAALYLAPSCEARSRSARAREEELGISLCGHMEGEAMYYQTSSIGLKSINRTFDEGQEKRATTVWKGYPIFCNIKHAAQQY
jgi:hypothetical protein